MKKITHPLIDLSWLKEIQFYSLKLLVRATSAIDFSRDIGSALRGGLGYPFKNLVCEIDHPPENCHQCHAGERCAFNRFYGNWNPLDWHHSPAAPRPFILHAPEQRQRILQPGDIFSFKLLLLSPYLPVFAQLMSALVKFGGTGIGRRRKQQTGTFELIAIHDLNQNNKVIFNLQKPHSVEKPALFCLPDSDFILRRQRFRLHFLSRTRLVFDKKLLGKQTSYAALNTAVIQSLFRRFYLLYAAHFNPNSPPLHQFGLELIELPQSSHRLQWRESMRRSVNHKNQVPQGGFVGTVDWPQEYNLLYPLLKLGQYLHLSKSATMGLGAYRIEFKKISHAKPQSAQSFF